MSRTVFVSRQWVAMLALATMVGGLLALPAPAAAAVSVDCDAGASLQAAIDAAPAGETITISAGVCDEVIDIDKDLILRGAGPGVTVIDGSSGIGSTVDVFEAAVVAISDLTVTGGDGLGGGVDTNGPDIDLTLTDVNVTGNTSATTGAGLWVDFGSVVTMVDSAIANNTATESGGGAQVFGTLNLSTTDVTGNRAGDGGGIRNGGGLVIITGGDFSGNTATDLSGGAIANDLGGMAITGATITDNSASSVGGGIYNADFVGLVDVTVSGNEADWGGGLANDLGATMTVTDGSVVDNTARLSLGGGIANWAEADLTVNGTTFENNSAPGGAGGGIYNGDNGNISGGTVVVSDSVFIANGAAGGGGIYNQGGEVSVSGSTFSDHVGSTGGGILQDSGGTLDIIDSSFTANTAGTGGGAISIDSGAMTISGSTIDGNDTGGPAVGGGVAIFGDATVTVSDSAITNNAAGEGAGIWNEGTLTATNSTFSGNAAAGEGGAISNGGSTLTLTHATIADNSAGTAGGGLASTGAVTLDATILAGNTAPLAADCHDQGGSNFTSNGYNLIGVSGCGSAWPDSSDELGADPRLGPLQDNGGATETMEPMADSPAIDAVPSAMCVVDQDQRGVTRPKGGGCDAGAVEVESFTDGVALFNPATGEWHLRKPDGGEVTFYYGTPGDVPLMGDWDCDGIDTVAMFRPSNGFIYLRNSNTFGVADREFFYGIGGDIPLAGDWNGDGCDTFAIYRNGEVFVANRLGTVTAEFSFFYGDPGDRPFSGDFDGDGITTVGLYRESSGFVYFRDSLSSGFADFEFFYGAPSDRITAGDWDGDGDDSVGIFRPSVAQFFLSNENRQGFADVEFPFGDGSWVPAAGHFSFSTGPVGPPADRVFRGPLESQPGLSGDVAFQVSANGDEVSDPTVHLVLTDYQCDGATVTTDSTTTLFSTAQVTNSTFSISGPPTWQGTFDSTSSASGTVSGQITLGDPFTGPKCDWGPVSWTATD